MQYSVTFCSQPEPATYHNAVNFGEPRINSSQETRPKAVGDGSSFFCDNCRPDVTSDIISCSAVDQVDLDVLAKFRDSRSKRFGYKSRSLCDGR